MIILVEFIRSNPAVPEALLRDGWHLAGHQDNRLCLSHPDVSDEQAARDRLVRLGLLTSAAIRVEFDKVHGQC